MSGKNIKLKNNDEVRPPELQGKRKSSAGSEKNSHKSYSDTERTQASASSKTREKLKASDNNSPKTREKAKAAETDLHKTHKSHKSESERRLEQQKKAVLRKIRRRERSLRAFNVSVIAAVMAFASLFLILGKRPTVDEDERRELATLPEFTWESYFNGSFTGGVSAFFNDAVPGRSAFKNFIALFRTKLGIEYDGVQIIGKLPVIDDTSSSTSSSINQSSQSTSSSTQTEQSTVKTSSSSEASTSTEPPEPPDDDGDMSGTVFVLKDEGRGISLFGGGKAAGEDYAKTVNEVKTRLGDGVNVYSMVIPTAGSYYLPKKYQNLMASERDNIDHINSFLDGVTPIDAYSVLAAHTDEYIYFRTDHHWTQLGAYYAAEEFAKIAGVPFAPLSEYETTTREGMLGSLYGYSGNSVYLKKNPDTFTFYKPTNEFTAEAYDPNYQNPYKMPLILSDAYFSLNNSYMIYGGDMQIDHVTTDCDNGRKLVIIGDSYDNAMFLNLTNSFSEIWVVDMRANMPTPYFNLNIIDFIEKNSATDVLFAMDTFSAVGGNRNGLKVMLDSPNLLPEQ